jgi:hypothetical protein
MFLSSYCLTPQSFDLPKSLGKLGVNALFFFKNVIPFLLLVDTFPGSGTLLKSGKRLPATFQQRSGQKVDQ